MRIPTDIDQIRPPKKHKATKWILVFVVILMFILIIQGISGFYIDFLWFRAYRITGVWKVMLAYKLGLGATFIALGFLACWTNIWLVERSTPQALAVSYEKKYIQVFQRSLMSRRLLIRGLLALLFALVFGIGASAQWKNWLLFEHAVAFHRLDPIFHRDISYFIFRLPFLTFVVSWVQIVIIVSLILDINVRLPADNFLAIVSLIIFVILVVNVYHRKLSTLFLAAGNYSVMGKLQSKPVNIIIRPSPK